MKVVQLSSDALPVPPRYGGAIETYIWNLSKVLVSKNIDVHIFSLGDKESSFTTQKIHYHTFNLSTLSKIIRIPRLHTYKNLIYLLFKLNKIFITLSKGSCPSDVIHSHYPGTALIPIILRPFLKKIKLVLTVHGEYCQNIFDKLIISK